MTSQIRFDDGAAYERYMGKWSQLAGETFLDWLAPKSGLRWLDVGCGNGAFTEMLVELAHVGFQVHNILGVLRIGLGRPESQNKGGYSDDHEGRQGGGDGKCNSAGHIHSLDSTVRLLGPSAFNGRPWEGRQC